LTFALFKRKVSAAKILRNWIPMGRPKKTAEQYARDYADMIAYHADGKRTCAEVALRFGCGWVWVARVLRRAKVMKRYHGHVDAAEMGRRQMAWRLYEEALNVGATKKHARKLAGLKQSQIFPYRQKLGIKTPPKSRHIEKRSAMVAITVMTYPELSASQIGRIHGLSPGRVHMALQSAGIPTSRAARLAAGMGADAR
jgi:hypothetical protein